MMKQEFEAIAGYEISTEDYINIIEPMYMAVNLSKSEFVKVIDKKRFALPTKPQLIKDMKKEANHLFEICGRYTDYESEDRLDVMAKQYAKRFYGIDWANDPEAWVYFTKGYECEQFQRGCSYPKKLHIGRNDTEYEIITLIK